jgi:hypothetical protein
MTKRHRYHFVLILLSTITYKKSSDIQTQYNNIIPVYIIYNIIPVMIKKATRYTSN